MIRAYLDNNATTRPIPEVIAATRLVQEDLYFNPSSVAGEIMGAGKPIRDAKDEMAKLLGAPGTSECVVLTSGASEANSWIVAAALAQGGHAVTCAAEHPSVLASLAAAGRRGCEVDVIPMDRHGHVDLAALRSAIRSDTRLVSLQLANNETGVIQPVAEAASITRSVAPAAILHSDATQAVGRIEIDLDGDLTQLDALSFSAHKFHGPRGVGGLYVREDVHLEPLIHGEQERGRRGGTFNTPAAAGLAVAAQHAARSLENMSAVADLRDELEHLLLRIRRDARVNGTTVRRLPNTSSVTFPGLDADAAVEVLALEGVCVSTGSACSAGATAPSHVLLAMGIKPDEARATLRFSLSHQTRRDELDLLVERLTTML